MINIHNQRIYSKRAWQDAHYLLFWWAHIFYKDFWNIFTFVDELNAAALFHKIRHGLFFGLLYWLCVFGTDCWGLLRSIAGNSFVLIQLLHDMFNLKFEIRLLIWVKRLIPSLFPHSLLVLLVNEFVVVLLALIFWTDLKLIRVSRWSSIALQRIFEGIKWKSVVFQLFNNFSDGTTAALKIL